LPVGVIGSASVTSRRSGAFCTATPRSARYPAAMAAAVPDAAIDAIGIACRPAELAGRVAEHAAPFGHLNLCAPPWGLDPAGLEDATGAILRALVGARTTQDRVLPARRASEDGDGLQPLDLIAFVGTGAARVVRTCA